MYDFKVFHFVVLQDTTNNYHDVDLLLQNVCYLYLLNFSAETDKSDISSLLSAAYLSSSHKTHFSTRLSLRYLISLSELFTVIKVETFTKTNLPNITLCIKGKKVKHVREVKIIPLLPDILQFFLR